MYRLRWMLGTLCLIAFAVMACASSRTSVRPLGPQYPAKPRDCEIEFFHKEEPEQQFEAIAKVESHIEKNFFAGGTVQLEDEAFDELGEKACELGGDAVVIDNYMESSAGEMTHIHVWATVVKYKEASPEQVP